MSVSPDDGSSSPSNLVPLAVTAGAAFASLASILALQFDAASRAFLPPDRLSSKRRSEYDHRSIRSELGAKLRLRDYVVGDGTLGSYRKEEEGSYTTLLTTDEEMDEIAKDMLNPKKGWRCPLILAIELDEDDPRDQLEYYLYFAYPPPPPEQDDGKKGKKEGWKVVQAPLVEMCSKLTEAFERQLTSVAFCFVSDASGGLATEILGRVLGGCGAGLALVKEPIWMLSLSRLAAKGIISKGNLNKIVFALCRLEGWRLRDEAAVSKTVVFLLPGQSVTPALLPLLQTSFPCERHVFAYDGAADTVSRGLRKRRRLTNADLTLPTKAKGNDKERMDVAMSMPSSVTATTPIAPLSHLRGLDDCLSKLPVNRADTLEAWMSAVDSYLSMKDADGKKNEYLPFVLRMGFLLGDAGKLGNGTEDLSELCLKNVLQYVTGSRSRPIEDAVLDAAREALNDAKASAIPALTTPSLSESDKLAIENAAFLHKGILIENKTLIDTVQPKEQWSLKAAKRLTGCACCGPEEEDEDEEEGEGGGGDAERNGGSGGGGGIDMSMPGAFAMGMNQRKGGNGGGSGRRSGSGTGGNRSKYVDGKMGFAFDPNQFGKP